MAIFLSMARAVGIEPTLKVLEALVLPLYYARLILFIIYGKLIFFNTSNHGAKTY